MKVTLKILCTVFVVIISLSMIVNASAPGSFSWYCKRNTEHLRPQIDAEMDFIEAYDGYYVDKRNEKKIYLTFDAGYENGNIAKILDVLKEENVKATFFILENLLIKNTELVKRMVEDGHVVGNHTATHKDVSQMTFEQLQKELSTMEILFAEKIGRELPKYFRPPEGRFSEEALKRLQKMGYKTIFWSFAYADWDNNNQMPCDAAIKKIMDNIHNGEIMLLHPTSATNAKILSKIIKDLKSQGFSFETVDSL